MHAGKEYLPLEAGPGQVLASFNSQVFKECGATRKFWERRAFHNDCLYFLVRANENGRAYDWQ